MKFKTSSGIKSIVGKDLITDPYVAIFELVKNSFDARAKNVFVSFNLANDDQRNLVIRDDGIGMSKSDLQDKWLHLAYSDKKEGRSNTNRVYVGSKGVGRFSCDRLGELLILRTKVRGNPTEHRLTVNWNDFDDSLDKKFESIEIKYSSSKVDIKSSYTQLEISRLRDGWGENMLEKVQTQLQRLKNPFLVEDGFNIYLGEDICKAGAIKNPKGKSPDLVASNISQILKNRSISVSAKIGSEVSISLFDRGTKVYELSKVNDFKAKDVEISIEIHYLTFSAKNMFARRMGVQAKNYGNIFVYRNGFHVSPYGSQDYDLFNLNLRKSQGYSRYIGTRELIGHISVSDPNLRFKETSSRNSGFIKNAYYEFLETFYMEGVHRFLEDYVRLVKWGEVKGTEEVINWTSFDEKVASKFKSQVLRRAKLKGFEDYQLVFFKEDLEVEEIAKRKQLESLAESLPEKEATKVKDAIKAINKLEKERRDLERKQKQAVKELRNLERQNLNLGARRTDASYAEQVGHHLTVMSSSLMRTIEKLHPFGNELPKAKQNSFVSQLQRVRRVQLELDQFKSLLTKTDTELRSAQSINWYEYANWHFEKKDTGRKFKVVCTVDSDQIASQWSVKCKALEYMMMLENFYLNAKEHGGSYLEIAFKKDVVEFNSDSTEINKENFERIFELGFSTKKGGTGIGMNQIKTFLKKVAMTISVNSANNRVEFSIRKK